MIHYNEVDLHKFKIGSTVKILTHDSPRQIADIGFIVEFSRNSVDELIFVVRNTVGNNIKLHPCNLQALGE